jgi:hypothetical protein
MCGLLLSLTTESYAEATKTKSESPPAKPLKKEDTSKKEAAPAAAHDPEAEKQLGDSKTKPKP